MSEQTETLRRAASLMRERAEAIPVPDGDEITASWADEYGPRMRMNGIERAEAAHIASWHPAVALAVADWLDDQLNAFLTSRPGSHQSTQQALAVARAYLGESA